MAPLLATPLRDNELVLNQLKSMYRYTYKSDLNDADFQSDRIDSLGNILTSYLLCDGRIDRVEKTRLVAKLNWSDRCYTDRYHVDKCYVPTRTTTSLLMMNLMMNMMCSNCIISWS